jgi:carbonic anhydrase
LDATIYNTGHGIKVQGSNFQVARSKLRNTNYKVLQFHMHTPSEHHINGRFAPLELHFVHEKVSEPGQGKYAVIGVMFHLDETKASPLLDQIIAKASLFCSV